MNERLKELRKGLKLTQKELADRIGVSQNFIAQIELGYKTPSDRTVSDICRVFGVSEAWLRDGIEPMFPVMTRKDEIAAFVAKAMSGDPDEQFKLRVISFLSKLECDEWQMLEWFCDKLADENKGRE